MADAEFEAADSAPVQLASRTAASLREMIIRGELLPGQKVHQVDIARQVGVSRSPLREALRTLEGEGLVTYETNRGYVIARLNMRELGEIFQLRTVIEAELIEHIGLADADDLTELDDLLKDIAAAVEVSDFDSVTGAVRQFHLAVYRLSHMPIFVRELQRLWKMTDSYHAMHRLTPETTQRIIKDHRAITQALKGRNIARVRKLMLALSQLNEDVVVGLPPWN